MINDLIIYEGQRYKVVSEAADYDYNETRVKLECVLYRRKGGSYTPPTYNFGIEKVTSYPAYAFEIEKVIFNKPATIVLWKDGTKTVVKCGEHDLYDPQTGLLMCIAKKAYGNGGRFNDVIREHVTENPLVKSVRDMCQVVKTALEGRASEH